MKTLIIARHGNTFSPQDTPTRVGARTDIPLVEKGKIQAAAIGNYLKDNNLLADIAYASQLQRTRQTAEIALKTCFGENKSKAELPKLHTLSMLNEIDYGEDENKTEEEVISRIGKKAIDLWDKEAIVPQGWLVDPKQIAGNWLDFAKKIEDSSGNVVFVVTSNGIARFAPHIAGNYEEFCGLNKIKLKTGALGIMVFDGDKWDIKGWNIRPVDYE